MHWDSSWHKLIKGLGRSTNILMICFNTGEKYKEVLKIYATKDKRLCLCKGVRGINALAPVEAGDWVG